MKYKKRILYICLIVLCLSLPFLVIYVSDYYTFHQQGSIENQALSQIAQSHPIIEELYQSYFGYAAEDSSQEETYVIREKDSYTASQQEEIEKYQKIFTQEIKKLVQYHILSESILEIDDINQYQVDFGTFNISQEGVLVQTFRMGEDYKELSFIMNLKTQKIISVSLWDDQYQALSKKDIQTMTWGMIQYLELNDIDDWYYNQNGYESQSVNLRVHYEQNEYESPGMSIQVNLIGRMRGLGTVLE